MLCLCSSGCTHAAAFILVFVFFLVLVCFQRFQILQLRADLEVYFGVFFVVWSVIRMDFSLTDVLLPAYLYWQLQKIRYFPVHVQRTAKLHRQKHTISTPSLIYAHLNDSMKAAVLSLVSPS